MIIELEFLEQISEDNWSLARSLAFISEYKDPWPVLRGLYTDECIGFTNASGDYLPAWEVDLLLKNNDSSRSMEIFVGITELGLNRAYLYL